MIEETAKVIAVDDENCLVRVEIQRQTSCGQCVANKSCGTAVLQKVLGNRRTRLVLPYDKKIHVNDTVVLGMSENALVKGSLAVYAIPLLLMIAFALLGELVGEQLALSSVDSTSIGFALVGLLFGVIWLKLFSKRIKSDRQYQPRILRKISYVG